MKRTLCLLLAVLLLCSLFTGCEDKVSMAMDSATSTEVTMGELTSTAETITTETLEREEQQLQYEAMTAEELYELAKAEGGEITVYATTTDAQVACKKFEKQYPDLTINYVSCDNNTVGQKIELEAKSGNVTADVVQIKDNSGEVFNEMVLGDLVELYMPESICAHIDDNLLTYGLPLYANFNPWYYNTEMYPDGCPIDSWWDIVEGYNEETGTYTDADGNDTQYWTIFTKDITGPSYASLWTQLMLDADLVEEAYRENYGKDIVYTYNDKLSNQVGIMELPSDNAGAELFYRFTQMKMTELSDGDGVVEAVDLSLNGPTLGLTSASKLVNADQGMNIAWVIGITPYTAFQACTYSYVVSGGDNPAGARLYINFAMGGDDGQSGCYTAFDKKGAWSVRDDVTFAKSGAELEDINLTAPDFSKIYAMYGNVTAYWTYWRELYVKSAG